MQQRNIIRNKNQARNGNHTRNEKPDERNGNHRRMETKGEMKIIQEMKNQMREMETT